MQGGKKKYISQEYSVESKGKNLKEGTKGSRAIIIATTGIFGTAIIVGISFIAFTIVFFMSAVNGTSMMRTLNAAGTNTDSVLVNRFKEPKRGDIIIIQHYRADGQFDSYHIKRLVAFGGESICFVPINAAGNELNGKLGVDYTTAQIARFNIEIDDGKTVKSYDYLYDDLHTGANVKNEHYIAFLRYQQTGIYTDISSRRGDSPFNGEYADGTKFNYFNTDRNRFEVRIPDDHIFYMGDNRGGETGQGNDFKLMSIDSTYFGPQPKSRIVGVAVEIVQDKTSPQWFMDKVIYYITFGKVKR
jgi:signal peptidase I